MTWKRKTDHQILTEIGQRIRRLRQQKRFTQRELAEKAGVNVKTLIKVEAGDSSTLSSFIQILRALDALSQLENFMPQVTISPAELARTQEKEVQRVRKTD